MKPTKELMEAARATWRQYYTDKVGSNIDTYADDIYDAYLAGFAAGQKSVSPPPSEDSHG